jgi:hypothetical protein
MAEFTQIQWIEARKREVGEEIDRLEQEMDELNAALKVLRRIEMEARGETSRSGIPQKEAPQKEAEASKHDVPKLGPPRPSGAPTNFEMVDMILSSAEKDGKDGLTIAEIINEIRKRYWPGVVDVQVSSAIYKFAKDGRFRKTPNGKFKRLKRNKEGQDSIEPNPPSDALSGEDDGGFSPNG